MRKESSGVVRQEIARSGFFKSTLEVTGYSSKDRRKTFTVQPTITDGFRGIVLSMHGSATDSGLTEYWFLDRVYRDVACYDVSWTVFEGDEKRELKEPRITPCR